MAALHNLKAEPRWMQEAEYVRDQRRDEYERYMQQLEDEDFQPTYASDSGGEE